MVKIKVIFFLVVMPYWLNAQHLVLGPMEQQKVDSMRQILNNSFDDSVRFQMSMDLGNLKMMILLFFISSWLQVSAIRMENDWQKLNR